jgi:hypothetical protein
VTTKQLHDVEHVVQQLHAAAFRIKDKLTNQITSTLDAAPVAI